MARPNRPHNFRVSLPIGGTPVPPTQTLLQQSDFSFLGYYDITAIPPSSQGLTHRYVSGDLRFLTVVGSGGLLSEFTLAGKVYGNTITTTTRQWPGIGGMMDNKGLWWDEPQQRLWSTVATNYTAINYPTQIYTRTLNDNLTISNLHGPISLQNIPSKRAFGGVQPVPAWFQTAYGVGPYAIGWGGGTSLVLQSGNASCGPSMYTMPDPAGYANGSTITTGASRTIMDFASANQHRGVRVTIPINYMDGGDRRTNPSTPPTLPPDPTAQWLSPRGDGLGWWTICDSYWNCGNWIDTPSKKGFVQVFSGFGGKAYYVSSDNHCDKMQFELHIFDPADFAAVLAGTKQPYAVEPDSMAEIILAGLSNQGTKDHMTNGKAVGGATYDPISKKLYLLGLGINNFSATSRLYVYQVAA